MGARKQKEIKKFRPNFGAKQRKIKAMNKTLIFAVLLFFAGNSNAQNPFEKYGYTPKIATLSKGKYQEFHDQERVVKIGEVLFDTKTKQIVGFVEEKISFVSEKPKNNIATRWISPDPLAEEYPNMSPYNFVKNNPIIYVDPDGRSVEVVDLYEKNEKGNYINPNAVKAFEYFTNSPEGKEYLSKYASKGQEIAGVTFEKSGEYDKKGIDLSFSEDKSKVFRDGATHESINENGRGNINILLKKDSEYNTLETIVHEFFIHAERFAQDFLDDNKFNYSNTDNIFMKYSQKRRHHYQENFDYNKTRNTLFGTKGFKILYDYNLKNKRNDSYKIIWKSMWDFTY